MSTLDTPVASLPGVSLSLGQLLQTLHAQGRLRPLVVEALAGRLVQQEARQAGLSVERCEGIMMKVVSNAQMQTWPEPLLRALLAVGRDHPELAAQIYARCRAA